MVKRNKLRQIYLKSDKKHVSRRENKAFDAKSRISCGKNRLLGKTSTKKTE